VNSTGNRLGRGVFGVDELEAWGWKFANDAITTINVVARAMRESMVSLKESGEPGVDAEEMVRVRKQIEDTIGLDEYYRIEEETVELAG
jgi:hypothetical protein